MTRLHARGSAGAARIISRASSNTFTPRRRNMHATAAVTREEEATWTSGCTVRRAG